MNFILSIVLLLSPPVSPRLSTAHDVSDVGPRFGWTDFVPSIDTQIIYVSSSEGNDNNDGLSPDTPIASLALGKSLMRDGFPDWLLLKRGDIWENENLWQWNTSGRSEEERQLISYYGDDEDRPRLNTGIQGGFYRGGYNKHLAIVGIHFEAHTHWSDYLNGAGVGIAFNGPGEDMLIEDCFIRGYENGLTLQDRSTGEPGFFNLTLRRTVVVDCFGQAGMDHSQGLYAYNIHNMIIEECVFDHNGWHNLIPNAQPTIFNHNFYIQVTCSNVIFRNNIIARGSSHGISCNPDGLIENNLIVRNGLGIFMRTAPSTAINNVILNGVDIGPQPLAAGITIGWEWENNGGPATITNCIIAHQESNSTNPRRGININNDVTLPVIVENTIVYNWRGEPAVHPEYENPDRDISDYHNAVGGNPSLEAFLLEARKQSRHFWRNRYTASAVNFYIRSGFVISP